MISKYHMVCVTRGPPVTSLIVPGELEDCLPPLADYASPEDRSGATNVRVRDHQTRTLQVPVWYHRLDMALSKEPATSGSLVRSRHRLGCLLAYLLGPRTAWELQFEDVVTQVLKKNLRHIEKRCNDVASSLQKCNKRWTKLCTEFDATSQAMEMITDAPSSREMEHQLSTLQTSLDVVERSIMRYENLIEDCRMQEEEISHEQEEEEVTNTEMVDEEECSDPGHCGPHGEADTEGLPPLDSVEDAAPLLWTPLEMLSSPRRMPSSCSRHPNLKIQLLDLTVPGVRPVQSWERWLS